MNTVISFHFSLWFSCLLFLHFLHSFISFITFFISSSGPYVYVLQHPFFLSCAWRCEHFTSFCITYSEPNIHTSSCHKTHKTPKKKMMWCGLQVKGFCIATRCHTERTSKVSKRTCCRCPQLHTKVSAKHHAGIPLKTITILLNLASHTHDKK